jgi:hypothetical protein
MSGKRMSEIIERFIRDAGTDSPEFYSDRHLEGIEQGRLNGNDTIFSYGYHFPLAEIIPNAGRKRGWWLLNGDRYPGSGGWGQSTSSQQAEVQQLVKGTGLPSVIVPFSAQAQQHPGRGPAAGAVHLGRRTAELHWQVGQPWLP